MKFLIIFLISQSILYSQNNTIHAFLSKKNLFSISLGFEKVNDTIDIFNIKEKEIDSDHTNFTTLGDMNGINFDMGYLFKKKYYLKMNLNKKSLNYLGSKLITKKLDIYLRRQFYSSKNLAFALDMGYAKNRANNNYMENLEAINDALEDIVPEKEIILKEIDNKQILFYRGDDKSVKTIELKNKAYIKVKNTYDEGLYLRAIISLYQNPWLFDFYVGYSEIRINNEIDSSIFHEENSDLKKELKEFNFIDSHKDIIYFGGIGVTHQINNQWKWNINYKYNYIIRPSYLSGNNKNHIIDLNINYRVDSNINLYLGGQAMLYQLNGEIPYMYTQYNRGSFYHKYGFTQGGIIYKF